MIGAPNKDVILFNGSETFSSNAYVIKSHINKNRLPVRIDPTISFLWSVVLKSNLTRLGTASPTNEIGPQNAVTKPVKIEVMIIKIQRVFLGFKPRN